MLNILQIARLLFFLLDKLIDVSFTSWYLLLNTLAGIALFIAWLMRALEGAFNYIHELSPLLGRDIALLRSKHHLSDLHSAIRVFNNSLWLPSDLWLYLLLLLFLTVLLHYSLKNKIKTWIWQLDHVTYR